MNIYKIHKDNWSAEYKAATLEDAQTYADSLGVGYVATYLRPYIPLTVPEKLEQDKIFCNSLIDRFIEENREAGITDAEAAALLAQFKDIMAMAQVGAVPSVYALLQGVTVGTIYTQVRKDRDLADLAEYMAS